ncbi:MAG: type II toxin-antitoxin system VapC family toxin [Saprospiraceae bacterium]
MGTTYLIDTNIGIYFLNGSLPQEVRDFLKTALNESGSNVSVITKIELLGWQSGSAEQLQNVADFIQDSEVLPLTDAVVDKTIEIRRSLKIKLPDAVIAATAIVQDFTLISRNDEDFRKIPGLKHLNPLKSDGIKKASHSIPPQHGLSLSPKA